MCWGFVFVGVVGIESLQPLKGETAHKCMRRKFSPLIQQIKLARIEAFTLPLCLLPELSKCDYKALT